MLRQLTDFLKPLLISSLLGLAVWVSVRELVAATDVTTGILGHLGAWSEHKTPWVMLIGLVVIALWGLGRAHGRPRGAVWGLWTWLLRAAFSWSLVCLVLLICIVVAGATKQSLSDLHWPLVLLSLLVLLAILTSSRIAYTRASIQR
jgi:hypothetical protein